MATVDELTVTINLIHGEPIRFTLALDETRRRNLASSLERGMQGSYLGVELEGTLTVIPFHNVRTIELSPAPAQMMAHVVREARRAP